MGGVRHRQEMRCQQEMRVGAEFDQLLEVMVARL